MLIKIFHTQVKRNVDMGIEFKWLGQLKGRWVGHLWLKRLEQLKDEWVGHLWFERVGAVEG